MLGKKMFPTNISKDCLCNIIGFIGVTGYITTLGIATFAQQIINKIGYSKAVAVIVSPGILATIMMVAIFYCAKPKIDLIGSNN